MEDNYPTDLNLLTKGKYSGAPLVCSGCAHSAATFLFPGRPSGERPCCFCIRNVERDEWSKDHLAECQKADCRHPAHGKWYDGSNAVRVPMDCYHSLDMSDQYHSWKESANRAALGGRLECATELEGRARQLVNDAREEGNPDILRGAKAVGNYLIALAKKWRGE